MIASTDACVLPPDRAPRRAAAHVSVVVTLLVLVAFIYWPVVNHSFVNVDDPQYVYRDSRVVQGLSFDNVVWALTHIHAANWHPVTTLSHMLDVQLFGLHAPYHLLHNVALHGVNTCLLYALLVRTTRYPLGAMGVALLFAVHPTRVESVAWVAERKDVLSGLFFMLTLHAYVSYVRQRRALMFAWTLVLLTLGLLAKPMLVTVPAVLLLMDVWPLRRFTSDGTPGDPPAPALFAEQFVRRAVREKLVLMVPVVVVMFTTYLAQRNYGAIASTEDFPVTRRAANAIVSYARYVGLFVWPVDMAIYPYPAYWKGWQVVGAGAGMLALTSLAVILGRTRVFVLIGWLWFIGMLVPVIGVVQQGRQPMADRFGYLPFIGLFIILVYGGCVVLERWRGLRPVAGLVAVLLIGALCLRSRDQVHVWRNSDTLLNHVMQVTHAPAEAFQRRGLALMEAGDLRGARAQLEEAVRRYPTSAGLVTSLAQLEVREGNRIEAERLFRRAMELNPDLSAPREGLSDLLQMRPTP